MEITFWGVRGTIPASGPEFNRYGGNTACVSIRSAEGALLILDAGTGITVLGRDLMQGPFGKGAGEAELLLTHAHWDHIQGFPFFGPVFIPGNKVVIHGPSNSPKVLEGILEGQMNPHFSPLHTLRNLAATIEIEVIKEGEAYSTGDLEVRACFNEHGISRALAYRIQQGPHSVVYAPDVAYPGQAIPQNVKDLYAGATYLIHDCTYTPEDQQQRRRRGQSSIADAARVAALCQVQILVMFHYDQDYTDDQVDTLKDRCRAFLDGEPGGEAVELIAAHEGLVLDL